jgi:exosortase K
MRPRINQIWIAQLVVVLLGAFALKLHYSTATVNQLRWILYPTKLLVELISGQAFQFESHAGYMSGNHLFLIAASCAGVNFMITAFLMLSLMRLWNNRSQRISWTFFPKAMLVAYVVTIVANALRISLALQMQQTGLKISSLDGNQLHRLEGILVYFGALLLLFVISERNISFTSTSPLCLLRRYSFPLLIYYGCTLVLPLARGAYRANDFWEHSLFVMLTPLLVILLVATIEFFKTLLSLRGISTSLAVNQSVPSHGRMDPIG